MNEPDERLSLRERISSRDTRYAVQRLLGIEDVDRLDEQSQIELDPAVHANVVAAVLATKEDYRERCIEFDVENDEVIKRRTATGPEYRFGDDKLSSGRRPFTHLFTRVLLPIDRPVPVDFHSHPTFSREHFGARKLIITLPGKSERTVTLVGDALVQYRELTTAEFSGGDLAFYAKRPRSIRSGLMGSNSGMRLLINPNFNRLLPGFPERPQSVNDYEQVAEDFFDNVLDSLAQNGSVEIDSLPLTIREEWRALSRTQVAQYCKEQGVVAYYNDDIQSPILHRLDLHE